MLIRIQENIDDDCSLTLCNLIAIVRDEFEVTVCTATMHRAIGIECMFSEWKHYVKVGLQGHRARDEADHQERIRAFELVPGHAAAYCLHVANNCASFIDGVRIFDN